MTVDYPRRARQGWTRFIPSWRLVLGSALAVGLVAVVSALIVFAVTWSRLDIPAESEIAAAQTSIVYWNDAETEMARLGDTNRISVPLADVPLDVQHAVLAAEDRSFYEHGGFAVKGFLRAVWANLTTGESQGGSTITQQYTKNAFLSSEKTYSRKLDELVLSMKLENELDKDQILERYLNTIYFGRGAYGIQTAAETYFGTQAKDLTREQAAVLAAIINAPGLYSPDTHRDRLQARYGYVLDGMVEQGWLTPQQRDEALGSFPEVLKRRTSQTFAGPNGYLLAAVKAEVLAKGFTEDQVDAGGLRIVSTFDKKAQKAAVAAVKEAGPTAGAKRLRIGLASVVPGSGEVVAMYGGADYLKNPLNNATQAIAQAGSTFKPFALAAAAQAGIALDSQWPGNSPHTVNSYTFQNYANTSYGPSVSLLRGTENSINSVYVELENRVGVTAVRDMALRAGIPQTTTGWDTTDNLTFVLGTASPHTLDVANAYATFAARGVRATPTMLRTVGTADGRTLYTTTTTPEQTIDAEHRRPGQPRPAERRDQRHRPPRASPRATRRRQDRVHRRLPLRMVRRIHPATGHRGHLQQGQQGRQPGLAVRDRRDAPVLRKRLPRPSVDRLHDRRTRRHPRAAVHHPDHLPHRHRTATPTAADPDPPRSPRSPHPRHRARTRERAPCSTAGRKPNTRTQEARQTRRHAEREGAGTVGHASRPTPPAASELGYKLGHSPGPISGIAHPIGIPARARGVDSLSRPRPVGRRSHGV